LDEDTSGLIVVAKSKPALEYLKKSFQDRLVEKEYLALVYGVPDKKHGTIDLPLEKQPLKQKMRVGQGKEALTEYWVLAENVARPFMGAKYVDKSMGYDTGQFSLLRVKLHTGRTHQIRAHLAHIGHPIVGDRVYGKKTDILPRQFLHAFRLKFQLIDQTWLELVSELPPELKEVLDKLSINY
jgi:23S rRNA pseudouridine1911/1915/1917 synthase